MDRDDKLKGRHLCQTCGHEGRCLLQDPLVWLWDELTSTREENRWHEMNFDGCALGHVVKDP